MTESGESGTVTYGVFHNNNNPSTGKWILFSGWYNQYEDAKKVCSDLIKHKYYSSVKIVRKTEKYEDVDMGTKG